MKQLFDELQPLFGLSEFFAQHPTLAGYKVPKEQTVSLITRLRSLHGFTHLVMMTCVDWIETGRFQLTYLLHNYDTRWDLILMVDLPREEPEMESIHHLWEQARVYQQELREMFGIDFPGSPRCGEPMILEGWQGPPVMRRDFDTRKYSEETYSHRPREINEPEEHMKNQIYPED